MSLKTTRTISIGCQKLFQAAEARLQHLAWKALYELEMSQNDVAVCCIFVDSQWKSLVDFLAPNKDKAWQSVRDQGLAPIAYGFITWQDFEMAKKAFPSLGKESTLTLRVGEVRYIALSDEGTSMGSLTPIAPTSWH